MTQPTDDFDDFTGGSAGAGELFEVRAHQDHLLIVKLWDEVSPVVTERCPTGYVNRNGREWPNNALRASVVDLDMDADDGTRGRVYPAAMIFAGLLIKELKGSVGKTLLLIWKQKDPSDKSSPYSVWEMKNDPNAVDIGRRWLNDHPEFRQIPAPPPWTNTPRSEDNRDNGYRRDDNLGYRGERNYRDSGGYEDRGRRRDSGPRDYGQHDDRRYERHDGYTDTRRQRDEPPPRRDPYDRDPWASRGRDDRGDGSFLSRSRNAQGGYQDDEPPF